MEFHEKIQALQLLMPDADYSVINDSEIIWNDTRAMPTDTDLENKVTEIRKEYSDYLKNVACQDWILENYPLEKQNSDNTDKSFWEPILKADGYVNLEDTVVGYIKRFVYNKEDLDAIMSDEPEVTRKQVTQLVKCGIRLNWVIDCKHALNYAIENNVALDLPSFPNI